MFKLEKLCSPAQLYLFLEIVLTIGMLFQNAGNPNTLCVGMFECDSPNRAGMLFGKALYVAFWTFILNLMCKSNYKKFAWLIVLFPFILFFILVFLLMLSQGIRY